MTINGNKLKSRNTFYDIITDDMLMHSTLYTMIRIM